MGLSEKQKQILDLLKNLEETEIATTKIAVLVSSNLYVIEPLLIDLENKGLIISRKKNNFTYWRIKNGREENRNQIT